MTVIVFLRDGRIEVITDVNSLRDTYDGGIEVNDRTFSRYEFVKAEVLP